MPGRKASHLLTYTQHTVSPPDQQTCATRESVHTPQSTPPLARLLSTCCINRATSLPILPWGEDLPDVPRQMWGPAQTWASPPVPTDLLLLCRPHLARSPALCWGHWEARASRAPPDVRRDDSLADGRGRSFESSTEKEPCLHVWGPGHPAAWARGF